MILKMKLDEIKSSHHVAICGMNGSGKTYLAKVYLAGKNFPNVIVYDTKGTFTWEQVPDAPIFQRLSDLMKFQGGRAIYRPSIEEFEDKAIIEAFFKWVYLRGNTIVYIDELASFTTSTYAPLYLKAIWTRGRELNVGCWASTQRPKNVPLLAFSEASFFFIFALNLEADRRRIYEVVQSKKIIDIVPKDYHFWFYNINMKEPVMAILK